MDHHIINPIKMPKSPGDTRARADDVETGRCKPSHDAPSSSAIDDSERDRTLADELNEFIIPPLLCRPLVITSTLPLVPAAIALTRTLRRHVREAQGFGLAVLSVALVASSVAHWSSPKWKSTFRFVDLGVVATSVAYGSWCAGTVVNGMYAMTWWIGMGIVGVVFTANEIGYYRALQRFREMKTSSKRMRWTCVRTVWTHLVAAHLMSNVCACMIAYGLGEDAALRV